MTIGLAERTATMWVVVGADGQVVVVFSGEQAQEAAGEWAARGYVVRTIEG